MAMAMVPTPSSADPQLLVEGKRRRALSAPAHHVDSTNSFNLDLDVAGCGASAFMIRGSRPVNHVLKLGYPWKSGEYCFNFHLCCPIIPHILSPHQWWLRQSVSIHSIFPVRGQPDSDRDYRHPRTRADKAAKQSVVKVRAVARTSAAPSSVDDWENLPPLGDLIDGVHRFTRYYFQLGFIAKQQFPDRLRRDHRSINLFLLMSILSISARLSPALRDRYGSGVKAAEHFMERASETAVGEVYQEPTLERCQAFYLLSIAQQGSGLKNKSYVRSFFACFIASIETSLARKLTWTQLDEHGYSNTDGATDATASGGDISTVQPIARTDCAG